MLFLKRFYRIRIIIGFLGIIFIEQGFSYSSMILLADTKDQNGPVSSTAAGKTNDAKENPKVENLFSSDYGKLLVDDTWHVFSAPSRWDKKDWLIAGFWATAAVGAYTFADKSIKENIQKNRSKTLDRVVRVFEPLGTEYSATVMGAFELEGYAFNDEKAKAVAHDSISSTIIASGLITPALKYTLGRSRPNQGKSTHKFSPFSGDDSFPSGHATQAFALASVIADHYDPLWIKIVSYGTASMVGYARLEQNYHFASDVLTGAIIGIFVGRTVVSFNTQKRYEIAPLVGTDTIGVQVKRSF